MKRILDPFPFFEINAAKKATWHCDGTDKDYTRRSETNIRGDSGLYCYVIQTMY